MKTIAGCSSEERDVEIGANMVNQLYDPPPHLPQQLSWNGCVDDAILTWTDGGAVRILFLISLAPSTPSSPSF